MRRIALSAALMAGIMLGACSSSRMRAAHPAQGGLASAPIETPTKFDYPAGGEGVLARSGPVLISGQPTEESLRRLIKDEGISVVICVRTPKELEDRSAVPYDEVAVLKELGVDFVNVPLGRPDHPASPEKVDEVAAALASHQGAALLHCTVGARASNMWAAYLIRHRGVDPTRALANAARIQPNRPMYADLIGADVVLVPRSK